MKKLLLVLAMVASIKAQSIWDIQILCVFKELKDAAKNRDNFNEQRWAATIINEIAKSYADTSYRISRAQYPRNKWLQHCPLINEEGYLKNEVRSLIARKNICIVARSDFFTSPIDGRLI